MRRVTIDRTSHAYGRRASEYIDAFGSIEATVSLDRDLVSIWAHHQPDGPILDVGCGPGQWTNWLHRRGIDVSGLDPTPEFITAARDRYPGVPFRMGHAERLDVADSSLAGILAWYSLIHLPPDRLTTAFAEFARSLKPGGGLLLGFFEGPQVAPFDHAIATAYSWPLDLLSNAIKRGRILNRGPRQSR